MSLVQDGDAAATTVYREAEFGFGPRDFERVRKLIHKHAGIDLGPNKVNMVYSRLSRRLRELRLDDFGSYLDRLEKVGTEAEWQEFVNALTTNLTSFFREPYHFPMLAEFLKPRAGKGTQRIWCSAASTGEEPWSIAMTVMETLGERAQAKVLATDIDTKVLDTARRAVYPIASVEALDAERRRRFFLRGTGANAGFARVRPDVTKLVDFARLNLLEDDPPVRERFDAIFCRNVMIYFDKPTQRAVLERLHRWLVPDGLLFVGHSENFTSSRDLFVLRGKTVYARVENGKAGA